VASDPDETLAYVSYYAGGFRVIELGEDGIEEVGAFVAEGGSNFWGVEVHDHPTEGKVVLAKRSRQRPLDLPLHGQLTVPPRGRC